MKKIALIALLIAVAYAALGASAAGSSTEVVKAAQSSRDQQIEAATK